MGAQTASMGRQSQLVLVGAELGWPRDDERAKAEAEAKQTAAEDAEKRDESLLNRAVEKMHGLWQEKADKPDETSGS